MNSRPAKPPRHRRLDADAVRVHIPRVRFRRVTLGAGRWFGFPLMVLAFVVGVAVLTLPILFFLFGTEVPGLVNAAGTKAPPEYSERVRALVIGTACWGVFFAVMTRPLLNSAVFRLGGRAMPRWLAVDAAGVWLARGQQVLAGLEWSGIRAVSVVDADGSGSVSGVEPPYAQVFPVDKAEDSRDLLGALIVTAPPPAHRLRGRRYLIRLDDADAAVREFAAGVERFGPQKLFVD